MKGALFRHPVRPVGLIPAGVFLLGWKHHLQADDLVPHVAHRHQKRARARRVANTKTDDLLATQIIAAALLRHTLEQPCRSVCRSTCRVGRDLGGAAFGVFLPSAHDLTLFRRHPPGLDLDLLRLARTPVTETTEDQRFVFLGPMLMDDVPTVFFLALVLRSLAPGQLAQNQRLLRLKAVVCELPQNLIEHNQPPRSHRSLGNSRTVCSLGQQGVVPQPRVHYA
ncbi:hypothetical protein D3C71_706260 [compost metagenome]